MIHGRLCAAALSGLFHRSQPLLVFVRNPLRLLEKRSSENSSCELLLYLFFLKDDLIYKRLEREYRYIFIVSLFLHALCYDVAGVKKRDGALRAT
jgi:hypothetical protein